MATIQTAIKLTDMMSEPLWCIDDATSSLVVSWEDLYRTTKKGLDAKGVKDFNGELEETSNTVSDLVRKLGGLVSAYFGVREVVNFVTSSLSELDASTNAQVQLATTSANMVGDAWEDAYDRILKKSSEIQSKGIYGDDAMIAAGAEFATYMTDTDAIELMMDTLSNYAMGMTGGGAIDSAEMVNYATNLGKIMTGAYDAMTKKGFEFSDAQKAVIEGTATQSQLIEALGEGYADLSSDMQAATVISDIINESWGSLYETMSNTAQGKIIQVQNAWGDLKEVLASQVYPAITSILDTINANWGNISSAMSGVGTVLYWIITVLSWAFNLLATVGGVIVENWSVISPILSVVAAAIALVNAPLIAQAGLWLWNSVLVPAYTAVVGFLSHGYMVLTNATYRNSAAQLMYNNTLMACPLTWILFIIIAVIAAIYAVVAAISKVTGTTISATGVILGTLMAAVSIIWNIFLTLLSLIIQSVLIPLTTAWDNFANFFGNIFTDPIATIIRLFENLANTVLGILKTIASGIDAIFGSNLAGTVQGWMDGVSGKADELVEKYGNGSYEEKSNLTGQLQDMLLDAQTKFSWQTSDAYNTGYAWGEGVEDKIGGFFGGDDSIEQLLKDTDEIAKNTGDTADALDITSENLKYLRDLAEQDAINRFTTAEVRVEMGGVTNNVNSNMDLDGVVDYVVTGVQEALERTAEGVHS